MESVRFRVRFRYNFQNNTLFIKKFSFEEIFISQFFGRQTENNAPIRADYILSVRAAAADIFQIATAAHRFHNWVEQHHHFGANTQSVRIDRAPIGASIFVADFFTIATVPLRFVSAQETCYFNFKRIFS